MEVHHHFTLQVVAPYAWKASSEYEENTADGGYYAVCLDNQFSKFAAKLVNLYLTTFRYDEWEKFAQELQARVKTVVASTTRNDTTISFFQDMDVTVANFTETLSSVDKRIQINFLDMDFAPIDRFDDIFANIDAHHFHPGACNHGRCGQADIAQANDTYFRGFDRRHASSLFSGEVSASSK